MIPQIIFIISRFRRKPSPDYVIAVIQLLACLVFCIMLYHLNSTTHHYLVLCLSLSMVCFTISSAMRLIYWLHYLVFTIECQVNSKKTSYTFMPLHTNNHYTRTINATLIAYYYQTQSYMDASMSQFCSLNDHSLLAYTTYYQKRDDKAL